MNRSLIVIFSLLFFSGVNGIQAQNISGKAKAFLGLLSPALREKTSFSLNDAERTNWHFVPFERRGTSFRDYDEKQSKAALELLRASISEQGYQKATSIMQLENVLIELEHHGKDDHYRDPLNYHFLIFGTPTVDQAWAWRFEGHHVSISFALKGNQIISSSPFFFGSNPGIVLQGQERGKQVLKLETELGFALLHSLTPDQLKKTIFADTALKDIVTGIVLEPQPLKPAGISYSELTSEQKKIFLQLMDVFVRNDEFDFSERLMKKIHAAGLDQFTFAWAGSRNPGAGHYYRIQGARLIMEYDNTQNNANHVHAVLRDLDNDFARDLLREHYQADHSAGH